MRGRGYVATAFGLVVLTAGLVLAIPDGIETRRVPPRPAPAERPPAPGTVTEPSSGEDETDAGDPREANDTGTDPDATPPAPETADENVATEEPPEAVPRLLALPVAEDAGRLRIGEGVVELPGLEAPSASRSCGTGGAEWPCGMRARTALRAFLRGRSIECDVPPGFEEKGGAVVSACSVSGEDIGAWIVANGWAEAMPDGDYVALETEAKDRKLGLWR